MGSDTSLLSALGLSALGMGVVFVVLIILMFIVIAMTAIFKRGTKEAAAPAAVAAPVIESVPARGSCGSIDLFDVPDRTAAQLMAVVADELKAPLNELRFISIKEITEDDVK